MTLTEWLSETGMQRNDFATAIGVVPSYVTLLCSEKPSWPGRDIATRIREVTGGKVTADDFLPPATSPEPSDTTPAESGADA